MDKLDPIKYVPPEAEIDLEKVIDYNAQELVDQRQVEKQKEVNSIQALIDKYDLIKELSRYIEKLVDTELSEVNINYSADEFPDVYMAMKSLYPQDADGFKVTYEQYKQCFDLLMEMARAGVL